MFLCLFEDDQLAPLLPLVHTRAVFDLRLGRRTLLETTRAALGQPGILLHTRRQVAAVTAQQHGALVNRLPEGVDVLFVNGRYVAEDGPVLARLREAARENEPGRRFVQEGTVVAAWVPSAAAALVEAEALTPATFDGLQEESVDGAHLVGRLWQLLDALLPALSRDYAAGTHGYNIFERPGATVHGGAVLAGAEHIYLAPGATVLPGAILNAADGAIYVDEHAVIMEGAVVRGPVYIGPHAQIKIGANVQRSAVGPWCKVGGEVTDSVLHSYSNKAHHGFLGHSYLGSWCNLGAGATTSNLRNDYGSIKLYDPARSTFEPTERQFMGLFMGDHAKCAINLAFNTGTIVGPCCNLFGSGFPPRYLPAFSWGDPSAGFTEYRLEKALQVARAMMARRGLTLTEPEATLLEAVFAATRGEAIPALP